MSRINNTFDLTGYVGAAPEKRFNPNNGNPIITLSLGVDDSYKDRTTGEVVERTDWFDLTAYREGLAGVIEQYVHKGSGIHVRGHLRKQTWESKDRVDEAGKPKMDSRIQLIVTEIRLLQRPKDGTNNAPTPQELAHANAEAAATSTTPLEDEGIPY